jgi:hypothetical protein
MYIPKVETVVVINPTAPIRIFPIVSNDFQNELNMFSEAVAAVPRFGELGDVRFLSVDPLRVDPSACNPDPEVGWRLSTSVSFFSTRLVFLLFLYPLSFIFASFFFEVTRALPLSAPGFNP